MFCETAMIYQDNGIEILFEKSKLDIETGEIIQFSITVRSTDYEDI
jgi:hypothetical protein